MWDVGLTDVDIPILGISGGGEYYLTVYLKFNVDEHELNNDEEGRGSGGDHAAEGEGGGWEGEGGAAAVGLLRAGQDGLQLLHRQIRQQRGPRSPASRPQHDQSANLKIVTIQIDWMRMMNK